MAKIKKSEMKKSGNEEALLYIIAQEFGDDKEGWEQLAVEMVRAMSDTQAKEILGYIARNWDIDTMGYEASTKKSKVKKIQMLRDYVGYDIVELPDEITARCPDGTSFQLELKPMGGIGHDYRYYGSNPFVGVEVIYSQSAKYKTSPEDPTDIMVKITVKNERAFDPIDDDGFNSTIMANPSLSDIENKIEQFINEGWDKFLDYSKISSAKKSKSIPDIKMSFTDNVNKMRVNNYAKTGNINTVMKKRD